MIQIKLRPYSSEEDLDEEDLEVVVSGEDAISTLQNLVNAINNDEVDDYNNELVIVIKPGT